MILPRQPSPPPTPDTVSAALCPSLGTRAASRRLSGLLLLISVVRSGTEHDGWTDTDPGMPAVALRTAHVARVSR
jgi:hypothetical protein